MFVATLRQAVAAVVRSSLLTHFLIFVTKKGFSSSSLASLVTIEKYDFTSKFNQIAANFRIIIITRSNISQTEAAAILKQNQEMAKQIEELERARSAEKARYES